MAKSAEPKLVGHIDTSWNLFCTQSISVLVVVGKGRFVKSPNKKLKLFNSAVALSIFVDFILTSLVFSNY